MTDLINGRTPEEIKKRAVWCSTSSCCGECIYDTDNCNCSSDEIIKDALALIEHLEAERDAALAKAPRWVSVEEQPNPPRNGEYWCHGYWLASGRKQTEVAEYLGEWKISNSFILTHWLLLPELPKEENK